MKKSLNIVLAGILAVPALALGMTIVSPMATMTASAQASIQDGLDDAKVEGQQTKLFGDGGIFQSITNTALYIIGAVSVLMLIYGGIRYTISGGNSADVTAAKNTILYAIIGIIVALLAYAIVNFVLKSLIPE